MGWLVVQFHHLEKYEFVNGKDDIPYMKWKIKFMFETSNQWDKQPIKWCRISLAHPQYVPFIKHGLLVSPT